MPTYRLPYGRKQVEVPLPYGNVLGVLEPHRPGQPPSEDLLLRNALDQPISSQPLRQLAQPGQQVAIVTSDLTRPCPSDRLVPPILQELEAAGIGDDEITVVVALGLHRPMSQSEMEAAVGHDVFQRVHVINHDASDVVRLGSTTAGTPIEIFRAVVDADLRICLGNLELHYFAGYSGGAKAIMPGCASRAAVQTNHAMMVRTEAAAGRLDGNPVRADLEEGAAMVGIDFILNVVTDAQHRILGAVAGDVTAAHRLGCEIVARQGMVAVPELADIVMVSAGGYPKDIDLYQAQKALDGAAHAVTDGGIIILLAECGEGFGNQTFETWLRDARSPDEVLERIREGFVLGGHKAAAVARVLARAHVYLVSSMPEQAVRSCGLVPFSDVGSALEAALHHAGSSAKLLIMPEGGSVLPVVSG
jgi:nickel-dependent lactate racemase